MVFFLFIMILGIDINSVNSNQFLPNCVKQGIIGKAMAPAMHFRIYNFLGIKQNP